MNGVRLLASWLWDGNGSWHEIDTARIDDALQAVQVEKRKMVDAARALMLACDMCPETTQDFKRQKLE